MFTTSALAAGPTVNIGTPFESGQPAVAVDGAGDAVVAWANTKDLAGANNFVQYCVLPVGATACSRSGNLIPADSAQYIDGVQVLSEGSTLVILADVYGAAGNNATATSPSRSGSRPTVARPGSSSTAACRSPAASSTPTPGR